MGISLPLHAIGYKISLLSDCWFHVILCTSPVRDLNKPNKLVCNFKKKNSTLSNLLYTDTPHNRPAVSLLLIFSYNKSVCNVQVCTQLQKFFASTRKLAKTARLANFRIHCDFRSLSHLQNLRELREITRWAIFHETWDFRIFFLLSC